MPRFAVLAVGLALVGCEEREKLPPPPIGNSGGSISVGGQVSASAGDDGTGDGDGDGTGGGATLITETDAGGTFDESTTIIGTATLITETITETVTDTMTAGGTETGATSLGEETLTDTVFPETETIDPTVETLEG